MDAFDAEVTVRRTRYASEQSGWAVLDADGQDWSPLVLVGPLVHLEERERAHVTGTWVNDSRYGPQVKVTAARPLPPQDAQALVAYLRRVRHIGAKRARDLVARFGHESVLEAIDRDPDVAFAAVGLRRARGEEAAASWHELRVTRQLHMLLAPHGLAYLCGRIHEHYGSTAHRVVGEQPYELTSVFGVGFLIADRIARGAGGTTDGPARTRAAVLHVLAEAERSGSTCMPVDGLRAQLRELLGSEVSEESIDELVRTGDLVRDEQWIYRVATAELEAELAERVQDLIGGPLGDRLKQPGEEELGRASLELTEEQLVGCVGAFAHRLSLITGGPGTGKTASIKSIAALAAAQGARVMLVAPTGRAAIRMGEASGLRATTVHSALGWIPGEGPTRDEDDPLACDLLIVDETSMANLELIVMLLRAVGRRTHVVLVGDADQLAPVGAGKPFAELVGAETVPTTWLTHIFRQAAGSMIVQEHTPSGAASCPSSPPPGRCGATCS